MRTSIIIIGILCLVWAINLPASTEYWENVGPSWDRMLNPIKYKTEKGND